MRHYGSEEWADYTRGLTPKRVSVEMERHLDTGCKKCERAAGIWAMVVRSAQREQGYHPPDRVVRLAKSYFVTCQAGEKRSRVPSLARLVFDSALQPQAAGLRSIVVTPRHCVYESNFITVDVWMEPPKGTDSAAIVGQILNKAHARSPLDDAEVKLWSAGARVLTTRTNRFGEFHLDIGAPKADLQLTITKENDVAVLVSFRTEGGASTDDCK